MDSKIWSYLRDYYKRNNAVFNVNPETPTFISNSSYIADVGNLPQIPLISLELCQRDSEVPK